MNMENNILKLSLVSSIAGIILLYAGAVQMKADLTPISKINKDFVGLKTKISGRIIDISEHSDGHLFLKVKDGSGGVISVPIFESTRSKIDKRIELLDTIQTSGEIKNYHGELELIPESQKDIKIIKSAPTLLSKINKKKIGDQVKIRGSVREKENLGSGSLLITIFRNGEKLEVFVPQNVAQSDNFYKPEVGETVKIGGTVSKYKQNLELKVNDPHNLYRFEESE